MYRVLIHFFAFFIVSEGISQTVEITRLSLEEGNIFIQYDLTDETPDRRYALQLYTSQDNFLEPISNAKGDIGVDVAPGSNKRVVWNAREELGEDFKDYLALEIKGGIYVPFIRLEGLSEGQVWKRGKARDLVWSGGRGDNVLNFELYQGENVVHVFEERPNIGNTSLTIPTSVKPGKNYTLKISDSRNKDEVVYTQPFLIKRKIPLGIKVGAGLIVGGVIGYLVGSGNREEAKIGEPPIPSR